MRGGLERFGVALLLACAAGCSSADSAGQDAIGASDGSGGEQSGTAGSDRGHSGTAGSGGNTATGESAGSGGTKATGGSTGSGGAKATGGSSGAGGASADAGPTNGMYDGAVVDGPCPSLPAAGTWKNISPAGSNYTKTYSGIDSVLVRPDNPAIIFSGADSNGIFKSTDCGANWALVSTGANAKAMTTGRPWSFAMDPVTPDRMYVVQGYGADGLWMTENAGTDWKDMVTPANLPAFSFVNSVSLDPTDHTHLVIMAHGGQNTAAGMCGTKTCVAESTDSGVTWKLLTIPVGWAEGSSVTVLNRTTWVHGMYKTLWYTVDAGVTWHSIDLPNGAGPSTNWSQNYVWQAPGGRYLLPALVQGGNGGVFESNPNDVTSWSPIPNSPQGQIMMATTSNLILGGGGSPSSATYWMASQSDTSKWTATAGPDTASVTNRGSGSIGGSAVYMAYDHVHHVLYDATNSTGLWQTVMQ